MVKKYTKLENYEEIYTNGFQLLFIGNGWNLDESHNCDAAGCDSVSHVLARVPLLQEYPDLIKTPSKEDELREVLKELVTWIDGWRLEREEAKRLLNEWREQRKGNNG